METFTKGAKHEPIEKGMRKEDDRKKRGIPSYIPKISFTHA